MLTGTMMEVANSAPRNVLATSGGVAFSPRRAALMAATVLVGLSAGFFYTYEMSVTLGLAEVSDVVYVETFQSINATIRNPAFGIMYFGAIPALVVAIATNWASDRPLRRVLLIAALALYLIGFVITFAGNVPLNEELATVENVTVESASLARADFEDDWNRLNLMRCLAIGASFVCLAGAMAVASIRSQGGSPGQFSSHTG